MTCIAVAQLIDPPRTVTVSLGIEVGGPPPLALTLPHIRALDDRSALADCATTPTTATAQAIANRVRAGRRIDVQHVYRHKSSNSTGRQPDKDSSHDECAKKPTDPRPSTRVVFVCLF
jgi:hypothetical protein